MTGYLANIDLHGINDISIILRLVLAMVCGGIIGLERGAKKRQAGFRTHILVCIGAAVAMMTNIYMQTELGLTTDAARLGAQVISGIGFLGVGVIMSSSKTRIKGLTTAAGLWASGCMGLAIGAGFYLAAIFSALAIISSLTFLQGIETYVYSTSRNINLYIETASLLDIRRFIYACRERKIRIDETRVSKATIMVEGGLGLYISLRMPRRMNHKDTLKEIKKLDMVLFVEEL